MKTNGYDALQRTLRIKPAGRFPNCENDRYVDGLLFPSVTPSFRLPKKSRVFTIGSCFARNIEEALEGYDLPTTRFSVPETEWSGRPNGLLNEYNPHAIAQRIGWAVEGRDTSIIEGVYAGSETRTRDMLLAVGEPVTRERAVQRRNEIDAVYAELIGSDAVIITLGLVECWFDKANGLFLNRMPDPIDMRREKDRYEFHRLDATDTVDALLPAFQALIDAGVQRVVLTVSPVPLQTSFTGMDCVVANAYSKAALLLAANQIAGRFQGKVDYFPSYEIVMSGGLRSFGSDNVHVRNQIVKRVISYMMETYQ